MRKGVSFSVIAIIALLGVLGAVTWSAYQVSLGGYGGIYTEKTKQDVAVFKLETGKRFLQQDLTFSSRQAALSVAANGGTERETYWYCTGYPHIPEPEEITYALSNTALTYMNSYVEGTREEGKLLEMGVKVPDYNCVGIYDPGMDVCDLKDSSECEYFWATGTGDSIIEVEDPAYAADTDKLFSYLDMNRFWWLYYRLYNDFFVRDYSIYDIIDDGIPECGPADEGFSGRILEPSMENALEKVCNRYENILFDGFVDCDWEIVCLNDKSGTDCLSSQCVRPELTEEPCQKVMPPISAASESSEIEGPRLSFQDVRVETYDEGSMKFRITLTDRKYTIPSTKRQFQNLVWNINGAVVLDYREDCPLLVIIPIVGGGGGGGGGSATGPSPGL